MNAIKNELNLSNGPRSQVVGDSPLSPRSLIWQASSSCRRVRFFIKARLAGEKALRELNQPIHTDYNKREPQQPKRRANLHGFANRVYPGQFAGAVESAECNRKTLHDHQSP